MLCKEQPCLGLENLRDLLSSACYGVAGILILRK